jgi:hypothetical protein
VVKVVETTKLFQNSALYRLFLEKSGLDSAADLLGRSLCYSAPFESCRRFFGQFATLTNDDVTDKKDIGIYQSWAVSKFADLNNLLGLRTLCKYGTSRTQSFCYFRT